MAWTTLARLTKSGAAERVAHGVYRLRGTPRNDDVEVRAAWLQLAPDIPVWERTPDLGVVSHRSAAALHHLGHLPADVHQFTLPARRQTRRPDVRLHRAELADAEWINLNGLLVTRPARVAADLLDDKEEPEAVAHVVVDALREMKDHPSAVARAISPYAVTLGLAKRDGLALLEWLLDLVPEPRRDSWVAQATAAFDQEREATDHGPARR